MTTGKKARIIPAVARLEKTPNPTKQQKLAQRRQIAAWRKKGNKK